MIKKLFILTICLGLFIVITSCATSNSLSYEGEIVQYQDKGDPPKNAIYLGTLQTNNNDSAISAINDLRNKTAQLGGDYLIIDIISKSIRQNIITDLVETIFSASGRAYQLGENSDWNILRYH